MQRTWQTVIEQEQAKPYFKALSEEVDSQRAQGLVIYPPENEVYTAFELTPLDQVKVVILGQDPYHGAGQAHGLAFSVQAGIKVPPSLVNMYKELCTDIEGFKTPSHGNLSHWAKQGVLLLNTVLTVQQSKAHSHAKLGWEQFTDAIIAELNENAQGVVFILWGSHAQKKGKKIDTQKHLVLAGAHPSPLSAYRGFWGCKHFSKANQYLVETGKTAIDWHVPEPEFSLA